jgi:dolichol-phosphate mannosyltransferase
LIKHELTLEVAESAIIETRANQPAQLGTAWIVLPAYNEQDGLPSLLNKMRDTFSLLRRPYRVVLVDDASTDDTANIGSRATFEMPLELVQHEVNQGLSGALKSGLETALELGEPGDVIITMDADDTHSPGTIATLLQKIADGYDVAIASRYQIGSRVVGVPFNRVLMTSAARWMFKMLMPIAGVRDYTCGFRAYRYEALKQARDFYGSNFVSEKGFSCMVDVLLKMRRFHFVMGEVPFLLRYDQKQGKSKMQVARTARKTILLLLKRRLGGY